MKAKIIILAIVSLLMIGCGENKTPVAVDVTGQWELADLVTTRSVQIGDQKIEVYIDFKADNTFKLWQMLGTGRHRLYEGTWQLTENTLTGKYSDGKEWGTAYEVSIVDDVLHMKETKTGTEIYVYRKCTIPSGL